MPGPRHVPQEAKKVTEHTAQVVCSRATESRPCEFAIAQIPLSQDQRKIQTNSKSDDTSFRAWTGIEVTSDREAL
jgi:hypothetical protein